jgi:hypothetical protein
MTLATKNGSLIVKDGKLAENCGCCGGWYCCASPVCLANPSSVSISIAADDFYEQYSMQDNLVSTVTPYEASGCVFGACMAGTRSLSKSPTAPIYRTSEWTASFDGVPSGCSPATVAVRLAQGVVEIQCRPLRVRYVSPSEAKQKTQLNCGLPSISNLERVIVSSINNVKLLYPSNCESASSFQVTHSFFVDIPTHRSTDEKYGSAPVSLNSRTGSNVFSITVTISL